MSNISGFNQKIALVLKFQHFPTLDEPNAAILRQIFLLLIRAAELLLALGSCPILNKKGDNSPVKKNLEMYVV